MKLMSDKTWQLGNGVRHLVSIIIPTYNREVYLKEAIQSVIDQNYRPIECIIIDDGSTDNTRIIVDKLLENNDEDFAIKYIFQQNFGSQVARNSGTVTSTGEFIQYLDSDDLLYPEKIKNQVEFLQTNKDCDGVWGGWAKGTPENNKLLSSFAREDLLTQLLTEHCIVNFSFLMRRKLIEKIGHWDVNIKRNQEIDFHVRGLLEGANYQYQPQICGLWRIHDGERIASTTGVKDILYFFQKMENILVKAGLFNNKLKKNIAYVHFTTAANSIESPMIDRIKMISETVRLNPEIPFFNTPKMKGLKKLIGQRAAIKLWFIRTSV